MCELCVVVGSSSSLSAPFCSHEVSAVYSDVIEKITSSVDYLPTVYLCVLILYWILLQPHRCQIRYLKVCSALTELFWKSTGHVWWSMRVRRERSMASSDTTISRMMARPLSASRIELLDANVPNYIYLPANRHMAPVCVPGPPLHFLTACSSTKSDATC